MTSKQLCPHCGAPFAVPANMAAGKKLLCRHCHGQIELAAKTESPEEEYEVVEEEEVEVVEEEIPEIDRPARPLPESDRTALPKKRKKKKPAEREPIVDPGLLKIGGGVVAALVAFGLVVYLLSGLFRSGPEVIPAEQWKEVVVANRYKAMLPGTPRTQTQNMGAVRMEIYMFEPDKNSAYMIGHMEGKLPPERAALPPEQLLDDSCNGSMEFARRMDPDSKELSRTPVKCGEHPGKELVVYIPQGKGRSIARYYLIHGRLYIIMALGRGLRESHENVQKLFDSFVPLEVPEPEKESPKGAAKVEPPLQGGPLGREVVKKEPAPKAPEPPSPKVAFQIELPKSNFEANGQLHNMGFSRDGKTLALATASERVMWFDVDSRRQVETKKIPTPVGVHGAAISAQADKVAFHKHGGLLYVWQKGEKAETVLNTDEGGGITQYKAAFSPDGETLCATNGFAFVRVWNLKTNQKVTELKPFGGQVASVAFSPDGSLLACADTQLSIWNPKTFKNLATLEPKSQYFLSELRFAPDGKSLFGISNHTIFRWSLDADLSAEKVTAEVKQIQNIEAVRGLDVSPDGKYLVAAVDRTRVRVWDAATLKRQGDLDFVKTGSVSLSAFRPSDGKLAVCCGGQILFLDLAEQKWD